MELCGSQSTKTVQLESGRARGVLRLCGPEARELVYLGTCDHGAGFLGTYSVQGELLSAMGRTSNGLGGFVKAFGTGGEALFSAGADVDGDGDGLVCVFTREGRQIVALGPDVHDQGGVVDVHDRQGSMVARWPDWP